MAMDGYDVLVKILEASEPFKYPVVAAVKEALVKLGELEIVKLLLVLDVSSAGSEHHMDVRLVVY